VQNVTPLYALQELAAWETEKTVRRYAHLTADHLAIFASNVERHGKNAAQHTDWRNAGGSQHTED
jgi:hypothetical protein